MDINRFGRLSAEGVASVVKTDDGLFLCFKRFNPENGHELEPEMQPVTADGLHKRSIELSVELAVLSTILAEVE